MSFLNNLVEQFTHQGGQGGQGGGHQQGGYGGQQGGYGGQQGGYAQQQYQYQQNSNYGGGQGPPQPPHPWIAEWDNYQNRWIYINRETGQRTHEFPGQGSYGQEQRGYGQQQSYGGGGYQQQQYGSQPPQQKQSHNGRNVALGAMAGLAGGALLMHEGHKVEERFDEDKYRVEERFDEDRARVDYDVDRADNYVDRKVYDGVQDVEDFPDDAARWTGRKVQEVEDIPDDIAYGVGDAVGDVERFGDGIDNAYDAGRDDQRYDDDNRW